ncbi:hypothetical protein HS088_TW07G00079 [Tripterygium wilfordii]|uniref:Uncharacterized protein n=1 Tax=Tripterygium wilfordii TaxID=458696 RepID=A0A7J7DDS0_TRIWF|nr:hypothetical protein HS088_TW07G00079 [Tripterygium wilfordii]
MVTGRKSPLNPRVLIVGNYCHDVLIRDGDVLAETLGGAASFISNVFDGLSIRCNLISKLGRISSTKPRSVIGQLWHPAPKRQCFTRILIWVWEGMEEKIGYSNGLALVSLLRRWIFPTRGSISGWPLGLVGRYCLRR